jgi:hypothetical protein
LFVLEVTYLISIRPGVRGLFAIGLLVIAFSAGGLVTSQTKNSAPAAQKPTAPEIATAVEPTPAITRLHSETAALRYVVDSSVELAEHVAHAVRPPEAVTAPIQSQVTHYGEQYNGRILGCGNGYYSSDNPTIVAVGPARSAEMPCGTQLLVCGPGGCIIAHRQDSCPGCSPYVFDLSESGFLAVCGIPTGVCSSTVAVVQTCTSMDLSWQERSEFNPPAAESVAEAVVLGLEFGEPVTDNPPQAVAPPVEAGCHS